ncbi:hypothetical protein [Lichenicoccus sp.]|uniref:hypothetical protein n=1 Tax=Lichenicoccus sp. TaxID=2781899 RepID=UPI003D0E122B
MHVNIAAIRHSFDAHALIAGVALQVVACLMSGDRYPFVQIGLGLLGVALMVIGFRHLNG